MSSGAPRRRTGTRSLTSALILSGSASVMSVVMKPGATALTVLFREASSRAIWGGKEAGRRRVDGDVPRGEPAGDRGGEANDARLARRVVRLARVTHQPGHA